MDDLSKEKPIGGHQVKVRPFTGSRSNKMLVRLQQCLDGKCILCTPDTWQQFCIDFLAYTFIDGKEMGQQAHFDSVFTANLMLLFQTIEFVSEVNFGKDFLSRDGSTGGTNPSEAQKIGE